MIPRDSFVMVLEKDRKLQEKTGMKKGCLACSSGKLCAKHANTPLGLLEQEEGVDLLVSPRVQGEGGAAAAAAAQATTQLVAATVAGIPAPALAGAEAPAPDPGSAICHWPSQRASWA